MRRGYQYGTVCGVPKGMIIAPAGGHPQPVIGAHKRVITKPALHVNSGATDGLVHTFTFQVRSPSARLRLSVAVFVKVLGFGTTSTGLDPSPSGITWTLQAFAVDGRTGQLSPLQNVYPTTGTAAIPDAAEFDTAAEHLLGTVTIPANTGLINFQNETDQADIIVQAAWEPNVPISREELAALYDVCGLTIDGNPATARIA